MIKYQADKNLRKAMQKVRSWIVQSSPGVVFLTSAACRAFHFEMNRITKGHGIDIIFSVEEKGGDITYWLMNDDLYVNESKYFLARSRLLERYFRYWQGKYKKFFKVVGDLYPFFISPLSRGRKEGGHQGKEDRVGNLLKNYLKFYKAYIEEYAPALVAEYFTVYSDHFLQKMFKKYPKEQNYIMELTKPPYRTFLQDERLDLLMTAQRLLRPSTSLGARNNRLLKRHAEKYFWITNNYKDTPVLTADFFRKELRELRRKPKVELIKEIRFLKNYHKMHDRATRGNLVRERISQVDLRKLLWLGKLAWMQDQRKKVNILAGWYLNEFLKEAVRLKVFDLDFETAQFLSHEEFIGALSGRQINIKEIGPRRKNCVYAITGGIEYAITDKKFYQKIRQSIIQKTLRGQNNFVRGYPASPGIVRGRVKIVLNPHKESINFGEILVTFMTRPDFVPLMKKAIAVVTNEGGITSHAAIVSRELGIPCVVGTKRATEAFRNGDIIEVNADEGVVRKIN